MKNTCVNQLVIATVAATLAIAAGTTRAQSAGALLVRLGATEIKPHVSSDDLTAPSLAGTKADIHSDTQPSGGITYMLTDHIAIDVPLSLPYRHDIVGAGSISGVGKIGDVRSLPVTVFGQYRFLEADAKFRPYLGAGLTYAKFYKARSTAALSALTGGSPSDATTLSVKSKFAGSVEAGFSVAFAPHWFVDASIAHSFLRTTTTLSTGQTLDTTLNPNALEVGVGYMF